MGNHNGRINLDGEKCNPATVQKVLSDLNDQIELLKVHGSSLHVECRVCRHRHCMKAIHV